MSDSTSSSDCKNGLVGAIIGGALLGSLIGLILGTFIGKRTAEGVIPGLDWNDLQERIRTLSEQVRSKLVASTNS